MTLPTATRQYYYPQIGSYRNLALQDVPLTPPKPSEVLVKIHAVSLQYRDLLTSRGLYGNATPPNLVPCSDLAGEIVHIGEDVTEWKVGDRVCASFSPLHYAGDPTPHTAAAIGGGISHGVLTQYKVYKPQALIAIPEHLTYEEASTLPCAALSAYHMLTTPVPVKAGDTVLVLGTGGVSMFALQFAIVMGAKVIVTSSSDTKLEFAKRLGASHLINYKKTPDWDKEVMKATNGRGVDHTIEVGGSGTLPRSIAATRFAGWVHIIGIVANLDKPDMDLNQFIMAAAVKGIKMRAGTVDVGSVIQFREMNRMLISHPEATRPIVDKVFSFEDAVEAFAYLESQKHVGKVVIRVA